MVSPLYPDFRNLETDWETMPVRSFLRLEKEEVGQRWADTQLLSLTKKGVIARDIDSGVGKYPASFEGYQYVEPGDLVFCLFDVEETPRTIGLVKNRGMITSAYTRARLDLSKIDSRYAEYLFLSLDDEKRFRPFYNGLRNTIQKETFRSTRLSIPPVEEQRLIADFLDRETAKIDALIAKQEELITTLDERRRAFIQRIFFPSQDDSSNDSHDWERAPLKRFVRSLDHRRIPLSAEERGARQGEISYYGASGVIDSVDAFLFDEDLLLVSEDGANLVMRTSPIAFAVHGKSWVNNHAHVLKPHDGLVEFWEARIESQDVFPWITGAAQPKLTADALMNLPTFVPRSIEKRQAISNTISELSEDISRLRRKAESLVILLREKRQALISAAVTGKLEVSV